nr:hypothetical protein RKQZWNHN_RKQZWNHN_CDS_0009 [Microvirus sp.]
MSVLDKIQFLRNLIPTVVNILNVIVKCLEVILGSTENAK